MPDGSAREQAPSLFLVPRSLESIAAEIERRVTFPLYARVREGQLCLVEACERLLPAAGECVTKAWRAGTHERNVAALLAHVDASLAALRSTQGAEDLAGTLRGFREELAGRLG